MSALRFRVAVTGLLACLAVTCGPPTPAHRFASGRTETDGGPAGSGGSTGGTGADQGGSGGGDGEAGTGGGAGTGQPPGGGVGGDSTGGTAGTGMGGGTGGRAGTGGTAVDAAAGTGGSGGTDGTGGTGMSTADAPAPTPAEAGGSGAPIIGDDGTALCHPDPNVIAICKQLEPACENCPDKSVWNDCFNVASQGDDQACAGFAVRNDCKVDQGGNTCGSLDCLATGCDRSACTDAQGNGNNTVCAPLLDSCPCR